MSLIHYPSTLLLLSSLTNLSAPQYWWLFFISDLSSLRAVSLKCSPRTSRLCIFASPSVFFHPWGLSRAAVTFPCWHLAWGLLLWSQATAVCSHPLNFIHPNLWCLLEALFTTGHKGQNQNTHIQLFLCVIYCCANLPLKMACSAPFTHCSPLIHSLISLWVCC